MSTATEPRTVRVTLEGTAHKLKHDDTVLIITRQDGGKVCLPESGPGITVEDITPARTWTDGDVIVALPTDLVWWRQSGRWHNGANATTASDREATRWADGGERVSVLRYQAGEL